MQMLETEKDKLVFRILNATESEQSRREIELCRGNLQSWALDNNLRDIVAMVSGRQIDDYCIMTFFLVAALFRHRGRHNFRMFAYH